MPSPDNSISILLNQLQLNDVKVLARCISLVENESAGYEDLLTNLPARNASVIGITGPPGAGKSTLVNALIQQVTNQDKSVGVLCVDPSSPFNFGALLGDRIRMNEWYNHPKVFIRSLAARGSLGGLHPNIIEITEVMKAFGFDYIFIETVGVGQSEVEIAGLADISVVVLSPEAGDEIQTMKAGIMEIADVFVVNKADRPQANDFVNNLKLMTTAGGKKTPVFKTIASQNEGVDEVLRNIEELKTSTQNKLQHLLLAERAFKIIQKRRMRDVNKNRLADQIQKQIQEGNFNLYSFVKNKEN